MPVAEPTSSPGLANLPAGRRSILVSLKTRGEARAEEVATDVEVTPSAVRQHLTALMRDGLVGCRESRQGPGRPKHHYHLTPRADDLFPRAYPQLANELLAYVGEDDADLLERVFARRRDRRVSDARARLEGKDLEAKVAELTAILDEDGYLADWAAGVDGSYRIIEHNCAILAIASRYGQPCANELEFIRAVLPEAEVERVSHIQAGQRQCAYAVRRRT